MVGRAAMALALATGIAGSGCALELTGLSGDGPSDAAVDAGEPPADGGMDAGRADGGDDVDAALVDAGEDAGNIDAGAPDAGPPPLCDATDPGLIACYLFEEDLLDGSSYANHAAGTNVGYLDGVHGRALYVTAPSGVTAPHIPASDAAQITMEIWARLDSVPSGGARVGLLEKQNQYAIFVLGGGGVLCRIATNAGVFDARAPSGTVSAADWTHFACTYDGNTLRLLVDATERSTTTIGSPLIMASGIFNLGEDSPSGGDQLVGRLDDARVYGYVRSDTQIAAAAAP